MSFTQGAPLPNATETTTTSQDAPAYYDTLLSGLAGAGTTALSKTPQQLVAGLDPLQTQAYNLTANKAASYVPGMTNAADAAKTSTQGITPEMIQQFMSPYTGNVVDEMRRQSGLNVQRNLMPALRGQFVGSGGFGGRRYAGALGQTLADTEADLLGAQTKALQSGYQSALDTAAKNVGLISQAAQTEGNLAAQMQALGLKETGALQAAGANQQAYEQSLLDAPLKTAANVAPLLEKYKVPTGTTSTVVGPKSKDYYMNSTLQNITGLAALVGGANAGTAATRLKSLYDSIRGPGGGAIDLGGGIKLNPDGSITGTSPDGTPMSQADIDEIIFGTTTAQDDGTTDSINDTINNDVVDDGTTDDIIDYIGDGE